MAIGLYIFLQAWSMKVSQALFLLFVLFVWMNMQHHSQCISHLFLLVIFLWLNGFIINACKNTLMSPIKGACHVFDTDLCHSAKSRPSRFLYWQIPTLPHCVFLWKPSHPWRHTVCGTKSYSLKKKYYLHKLVVVFLYECLSFFSHLCFCSLTYSVCSDVLKDFELYSNTPILCCLLFSSIFGIWQLFCFD